MDPVVIVCLTEQGDFHATWSSCCFCTRPVSVAETSMGYVRAGAKTSCILCALKTAPAEALAKAVGITPDGDVVPVREAAEAWERWVKRHGVKHERWS